MTDTRTITRTDWGKQNPLCFLCGQDGVMETHEIMGAAARGLTVTMPCMWLRCCRACHATLTSTPRRDEVVRLLVIKRVERIGSDVDQGAGVVREMFPEKVMGALSHA